MTRHNQRGVGLGDLFIREPGEWGLRGDPYLWAEMRTILADCPLPASDEELGRVVASAFQELTGQSLDAIGGAIVIKRFARGGMSSGHVDPAWWCHKAVPELSSRLRTYHEDVARFRAVIEGELVKKPRRLPREAVAAFLDDAAQQAASIAETNRCAQEQIPEGWGQHYDNSQRSLESLARGLRRQTAYGRRALLRQAMLGESGLNTLKVLASGDLRGDWDATLDKVAELILAAAGPPGEKLEWRHPDRAQEVAQTVRRMATLWHFHLKKEPKAADGAPFSDVVSAIWAELSAGKPLSWKTIGQALKNSATAS